MLLTPHVLTGMLVGGLTPSIFLVPFTALISFVLVELIPHWDPSDNTKKRTAIIRYIDFFLALIALLVVTILKDMSFGHLFGGFFVAVYYIFFFLLTHLPIENPKLFTLKHFKKKLTYSDRSFWGILIQASICILVISIMFDLIDFPTWDKLTRNLFSNVMQ